MHPGGDIYAEGDIYAGGDVYTGGDIYTEGDIYAGGDIYAEGDICKHRLRSRFRPKMMLTRYINFVNIAFEIWCCLKSNFDTNGAP